MFTAVAVALLIFAGVIADHQTTKEREKAAKFEYDPAVLKQSIQHSREDLKLIAILLSGVLIMLGIIADRLH